MSVASQLITCPKVMFLDEPTSGLDSTASFEVISYVKELARVNNVSEPLMMSFLDTNVTTAHHYCEYPPAVDHDVRTF